MKKLLAGSTALCAVGIQIMNSPPDAFRGPAFKQPTFAPADTGMTVGGIAKFESKLVKMPADTGATQGNMIADPMYKVTMEPEGLGRGALPISQVVTRDAATEGTRGATGDSLTGLIDGTDVASLDELTVAAMGTNTEMALTGDTPKVT